MTTSTGVLYAATDFGVMKLASGGTSWALAGPVMPMVEFRVYDRARKLILDAATHGMAAWVLDLPKLSPADRSECEGPPSGGPFRSRYVFGEPGMGPA